VSQLEIFNSDVLAPRRALFYIPSRSLDTLALFRASKLTRKMNEIEFILLAFFSEHKASRCSKVLIILLRHARVN
jgi:hypothetical protein